MAPSLDPDEEDERDEERHRLRNLGFGQAVSGVFSAVLGLIIIFISRWKLSFPILVGTPWWTGVLATVAGLLALAVRSTTNKSMTIACLVGNILCAMACTPAVLLYSLNVRFYPCFAYCYVNCRARIISAITIALLLNCLISLVMSVAIAIINCRNIQCCTVDPPTTMIVVHANQMAPADHFPQFANKDGQRRKRRAGLGQPCLQCPPALRGERPPPQPCLQCPPALRERERPPHPNPVYSVPLN
ncbi:uncharacterized protein [Chiloscyllium punctatum]|uniref:uncharacterized protein n=1 Tax=Chiloscyllium punctatum TaxID=137246 RepID=UPI003B642087